MNKEKWKDLGKESLVIVVSISLIFIVMFFVLSKFDITYMENCKRRMYCDGVGCNETVHVQYCRTVNDSILIECDYIDVRCECVEAVA